MPLSDRAFAAAAAAGYGAMSIATATWWYRHRPERTPDIVDAAAATVAGIVWPVWAVASIPIVANKAIDRVVGSNKK